MTLTTERLYNLMPAIYRIRDADDGQTLRAFMAVLERIFANLEDDIDSLYEDWFIETCNERMVPLIADLLGVSGLLDLQHIQGTRRRQVANVTLYRKSSGSLSTLQDVAHDLTGWPVQVVDLAGLVAATQHVQHAGRRRGAQFDVRSSATAVGSIARGVDVRHIVPYVGHGGLQSGRVRNGFNLNDVGVFFWRLQPYPVVESTPASLGPGRYTFDPTGLDTTLFLPARTPPRTGDQVPYLPLPLERSTRPNPMPFSIWLTDSSGPVPDTDITLTDLSNWRTAPDLVSVDPLRGRIACPPEHHLRAVSYWYGFSGDVGAGPYPRQSAVQAALARRPISWRAFVSQRYTADPAGLRFDSLNSAVQAWNALAAGEAGVIAILDNATYSAPADPLVVRDGSSLALIGAQPAIGDEIVATMARPCVEGDLAISGSPAHEPGELLVDGILWNGALHVQPADLGSLTLAHTTLVPSRGGLHVAFGNSRLVLHLDRSICGPLVVLDPNARVELAQSIVDAEGDTAIYAPSCWLDVRGATLFGFVRAGAIDARDSLLLGSVDIARHQVGGIEYCFVSESARTPHRHHCQPDLELGTAPHDARDWIRARLVPSFTSTHYGDAGYAQLTPGTPSEIRAGARNDAEMGAFHLLYQPLRMTSFVDTLRNYLPAGRDVGVFFPS